MSIDAIHSYYAQYDEWGRLETPAGRLELRRCLQIIGEHLPPNSRVLDLGGGPGRYTIELVRRGHRVTLVDLCDNHVRRARRELAEQGLLDRVEAVSQGDARSVDALASGAYDAVIAFGPFYHLIDADDRRRAAGEVHRLLRDEGLAFVQFLPPASGFVRLLERAADSPAQVTAATIDRALAEHVFQNPSDAGFQEGYYAEADEITELFAPLGVEPIDVVSVRGVAAGREEKVDQIGAQHPELFDKVLQMIDVTARRAEVIAMGQIALWVGRKRTIH